KGVQYETRLASGCGRLGRDARCPGGRYGPDPNHQQSDGTGDGDETRPHHRPSRAARENANEGGCAADETGRMPRQRESREGAAAQAAGLRKKMYEKLAAILRGA